MPIDPIVAAEIRGLFYGEGNLCLQVQRKRAKRQGFTARYTAVLRMKMRADDSAVLFFLRDTLGGSVGPVYIAPKARRGENGQKPSREWCLWATNLNRHHILRVIDLLAAGTVPSKKRRELALFAEAVKLLPPRLDCEVARFTALADEMSALKRFDAAPQNLVPVVSQTLFAM